MKTLTKTETEIIIRREMKTGSKGSMKSISLLIKESFSLETLSISKVVLMRMRIIKASLFAGPKTMSEYMIVISAKPIITRPISNSLYS